MTRGDRVITRSYAAAVCFTGFCFFETRAMAETVSDADRARAVFREARALVAAGNYAEACPKFEESLKLDVGIGTKFNLADCFAHVGRPASAKVLFLEVAERAHESGQTEREGVARARASALDAAIPQIILDVKIAAPKLEIRRDGVVIEPSTWGAPEPVDPGKLEIAASAPGKKTWSKTVDVSVAASPLTVSIPELSSADSPPPVVPTAIVNRGEASDTEAPPKREEPSAPPPRIQDNTVPILLYAGVGAGVLLTSASLVLYKLSNDKAETICPRGTGCTADEVERHGALVNDARTSRGLAYLGLGLTGASLAAAGIVSLTHPGRKERAPNGCVSAGPLVGRDELGATVQGSF